MTESAGPLGYFFRSLGGVFTEFSWTAGEVFLLIACVALTVSQVLVSYCILTYYPTPLFLTWWQLLQLLISASIVGELGVSFPRAAIFPPVKLGGFKWFVQLLPYSLAYCAFHAVSNSVISDIVHPAALPVASGLLVAFHHMFRSTGCQTQYTPLRWGAVCVLAVSCFFSIGYLDFYYCILLAVTSAIYRGAYMPRAIHMSGSDEGSLTAACSLTGVLVLPLVIWLADEQPELVSFSKLTSFDVHEWLILGCWITAGTVPFFKSVVSNQLMKALGPQAWRISELASVLAVFFFSVQLCGPVGLLLWLGLALLIAGRLCCAVDSYEERRQLSPQLTRTYYSRRLSRRDSSVEGSFGTVEEGLLEHISPEQAEDIREKLTGLVKAYVTRTQCEDLTMLKNMGGADGIAHMLHVQRSVGLSDPQDIEHRRKLFGVNRLPSRASASFLSLCIDAASDNTLQILMVCGLASIVLSQLFGENPQVEWMEGAAIWVAVLVVVLVTAGNDWMKEQQFRQLSAVKDDKNCTVLRDGCPTQVSVFDLVLGDLLQFEAGDELPADCIVVSCRSLRMDESSLTGESEMIKKDTYDGCIAQIADGDTRSPRSMQHHFFSSPVVLSGTTVNSGSGSAIVIAVGQHSQSGQLYQKLSFDTEATPLQLKLNALAGDIGNFGLVCAIIALCILVLEYWIIFMYTEPDQRPPIVAIIGSHVHFFVTAITVLVVAVPEGLPLAVTISLAYSIGQMLADQNYVRRLGACETMGSANEVCSDKTGTLTRNQMSAVAFWNGSKVVPIPSASFAGPNTVGVAGFNEHTEKWNLISESISLNSTAYLEKMEVMILNNGQETPKYTVKYVGSATECALLEFNDFICGADYAETRRLKGSDSLIAHREDFSSDRKMMTTIVHLEGGGDARLRVYVKGAAERVLNLCNYLMNANGEIQKIQQEHKAAIEDQVIDGMAREALRTICIAYRDFSADDVPDWEEKQHAPNQQFLVAEQDLVCLGIFGIMDPVRDEVPEAVEKCHQAGINVRMVTGDNLITAKAIAKKCHIFNEERGDMAMLGPDFTKLVGGVICQTCRTAMCGCATDAKTAEAEGKNLRVDVIGNMDAFERIWRRLQVLARSQPSDKYVLVTALKQLGQVVAVTGDGTNDAPALKKADVGLAMGITGKEVAKQAADIVMLDDNFQCIVQAVKWGRNVYSNIRRFLQFQLTVNVVAVITTIICAALLRDSPLTAVQMLWVNLIMDSFASLALATELPTPDLLKQKPHHRHQSLISRSMALTITTSAVYQLVVMVLLIFYGDSFLPETEWGYLLPADRTQNDFCEFSDCDPVTGQGSLMRSGRRFKLFSTEEDYEERWVGVIGPSRHLTFVFNTFVLMQLFNMISARDVEEDFAKKMSLPRLFVKMTSNPMGFFIWLFILFSQVLMVEYGGAMLGCHREGLTWQQWSLSLLIGFVGLLFARIPQCFPQITRLFPEYGMREEGISGAAPLALNLRGRSPSRMNDRCMISTLAVAKKYARRAKVLTISRMKARREAPQAQAANVTAVTDGYLPVQLAA
ncbi:Ca2+-ATPase, putative [Eimeria tenella]|uniref:Ca2+-ATPase, putative n=1 Tax=Eimeria tenella TaxID=5802 RepID=U6KTT2_EIMTE|nr:Ca2+-ATPase, putative [Eimeria tenella]CDJ41512.1 Ca2+-ATPase, putative [Eimeria tenella]|eukprot:XP_013232262.1 Ca2+-ATPase, putative [Eimeria tenella]